MEEVPQLTGVDWVVIAILAIAILRGLFLGLVREAFSILALGGACILAWLYTDSLAGWVNGPAGSDLNPLVARGLSGAAIVVGVIIAVTLVSRMMQRGVKAAGLGFADRLAGGILGAAEGALAATLLLSLGTTFLGADHSLFAGSEALRWLQIFQNG